MNTPTAMEFAAATLEAKSSIQGAQMVRDACTEVQPFDGQVLFARYAFEMRCERENKSHRYRVPCRSRLLGIARDPRR